MRKISHIEACEYIYETKEEREDHIKLMEERGWHEDGGKARILKDGTNAFYPTSEDYVWYARFSFSKMNLFI